MTTIENLVNPLKQDAIDAAVKFMEMRIEKIYRELGVVDWDINEYAPRANYHDGDKVHREKTAKRALVERIVKRNHDRYISKGVDIVEKDDKGVERLLKIIADDAGISFDKYVAKLVSKVGVYKDAELTGNYLWNYSVIRVEKEDGSYENWQTKAITNYSKFGLAFNQFPTRKVK